MYQRTEFANKAIDEYKLALQNDPNSAYLNAGLASLYFHTNRIHEAINEAQQVIARDPNNVDARRLLGGIYLQLLGDTQTAPQSREMLQKAIEQYEAIVRIDGNDVDSHLLLGRLYMLDKDLTKAEREFKTVLNERPANEDALSYLTYLYNEEGDPKKAASLIEAMPEQQRSAKVNAALGYSYEQLHQNKKAIDAYRKAVVADPENLDVQRGLAKNLASDGQYNEALKVYKQVHDGDPQDADTLLKIAELERRLGQYDEAMADLKKAEQLVPESQEVPYDEAVILEAQGKLDEAIAILNDLVEKGDKPNLTPGEKNNRAIFLEHLGNIYKQQGKTQQAVDTYRKIVDLGGDQSERGWDDIIDAYRDARQWPQATQAAQDAVKAMPNSIGLKLALAAELADTGKVDEGAAMAQSLLHKDADRDRDIYLSISQIYSRARRFKEAEEALKQADAVSKPEDKKAVNFYAGALYEREKKYDLAEQYFHKVLAEDPTDASTLNYLGYMLAERGTRLDDALANIRKALEQEPQSGYYLDSLGWVYYKLGKYDLAEQTLRHAAERLDNDGTVHEHLGEVLEKTGRIKLAAAQYERAMQEFNRSAPGDNDPQEVAEVQKKLESARVKMAKEQMVR